MRYLGGKYRIAKQLTEAILTDTPNRAVYREPFIGGASMFEQMAPHFKRSIGGDVSEDLVLLWRDLASGKFTPPVTMSPREYQELRHAEPSALRAYAGFGLSFAGKFFAGFGTGLDHNQNGVDFPAQVSRGLRKTQLALLGLDVTFIRQDYEKVQPQPGDVIYCDPPYVNTTGYRMEFDHRRFWLRMQQWTDVGAQVYVSELTAPRRWEPIWEHKITQQAGLPEDRSTRTEKLYTRRP